MCLKAIALEHTVGTKGFRLYSEVALEWMDTILLNITLALKTKLP